MIDKLCVQFRVFDWLPWYKDYFEDVSKHNIIEAKELCKLEEKGNSKNPRMLYSNSIYFNSIILLCVKNIKWEWVRWQTKTQTSCWIGILTRKKLAKSHNLSLSSFCNFIFRGIKEGGGGKVEMVVGGWYGWVVHLQTSFEVFNVSPFHLINILYISFYT